MNRQSSATNGKRLSASVAAGGVTPKRRSSSGTGLFRGNSAQRHRRSSIRPTDSVRFSHGNKKMDPNVLKDPRNLQSRAFQKQIVEDIVCFLQDNNYGLPITVKTLTSPTSKEFIKVFEFLYKFFHPKFVISKRFEEDVPRILKQLRYPFPISKSALYSIGSQHAWPALLGLLHWMTELIKYCQNVSDSEIFYTQDEDELLKNEALLSYSSDCYAAFLSGVDDFSAYDDGLAATAISVPPEENDALELGVAELEAELASLTNEPDEYTEAATTNAQLSKQLEEETTKSEELERKKNNLEKMNERLVEDIGSLGIDPSSLTGDPLIAERLQADFQERQQLLLRSKDENDKLTTHCQNEEMEISKSYNEVSKQIDEYNSTCAYLVSNSENPLLQNNSITMSFVHQKSTHVANSDFQSRIKGILDQLQRDVMHSSHNYMQQKIKMEETLDQLNEICSERAKENMDVEAKLQQLELEEDLQKKSHELKLETLSRGSLRFPELEEQLASEREACRQKAEEHELEMERLSETKKRTKVEEEEYAAFLIAACKEISSHIDQVAAMIDGACDDSRRELEEAKQLIEDNKTAGITNGIRHM